MAINAKDYLAKLPKARRDAIQARAEELIAEERDFSLNTTGDLPAISRFGLES